LKASYRCLDSIRYAEDYKTSALYSCNDTTGRLQSCWRVAKFHVDRLVGSNAARGERAAVDTVELHLQVRGIYIYFCA